MRAAGGPTRTPLPQPPPAPEPSPVFELAAEAAASAPPEVQPVEDPFSETTGAMDLRWDRDAREPFNEPQAAGPLPAVEPSPAARVAVESPVDSPAPEAPMPFALPAEDDAFPADGSPSEPLAFSSEAEAGEGPGDETLTRLSREAESIDLRSVFPKSPEPAAFRSPSRGGPRSSLREKVPKGSRPRRRSRTTKTPS